MTDTATTATPGTSAAEAGQSEFVEATTSQSGIRRLDPADGLFLRAEHLRQMEDYAFALSRAVGIAGGTGVAYGYGLSLDDARLHVTPGLAVDARGVVLRSEEALSIDLGPLAVRTGRFWLVEIGPADPVPSGREPVYGDLCADACARGTIQPWLDAAVRVRVTPNDTLPGLSAVSNPGRLRSWLASAYFESERRAADPWLTPGAAGAVASLLGRPWAAPRPDAEPAPAGVPLGVLLRVGDTWVLDVWTARRDLGGTPPRTSWEGALGLRPWPAFVAQVLQFQAQLATAPVEGSEKADSIDDAEDFVEFLLKGSTRSRRAIKEAYDKWRGDHPAGALGGSLLGRGFGELPPAGFLPRPAVDGDPESALRAVFGDGVEVRVRHGSADSALRAVTAAQHLDRIPLEPDGARPAVEVWVPDQPSDLSAVRTGDYGWVAFARDRDAAAAPPPAPDPVAVHVFVVEGDTSAADAAKILRERTPDGDPVCVLDYPAGAWAVPGSAEAHKALLAEVARRTREGMEVIGLVAAFGQNTSDLTARRPLGAARAALVGVELQAGVEVEWLPLFAVPAVDGERIWLILRPVQIG